MRARTLAIALLASLPAFAACDTTTGPLRLGVAGTIPGISDTLNVARIRFVNATATTVFDVAQGGVIDTGNGSLRFGMSSRCVTVVASSPILDVRQTGTSVTFPGFNLTLQGAGRYTIIAFTDVTGATQFITLFNNVFVPLNGQIGFSRVQRRLHRDRVRRVGHRAERSTHDDDPVAAAVLGGVNSGFVGVDVTTVKQIRITTANSTTVVLDLGNVTFVPDVNTILVIAPPLPGSNIDPRVSRRGLLGQHHRSRARRSRAGSRSSRPVRESQRYGFTFSTLRRFASMGSSSNAMRRSSRTQRTNVSRSAPAGSSRSSA